MGSVFEEMCRSYTLEQGITGLYDTFITETGNWWGTESIIMDEGNRISQSADIDVIGISSIDKGFVVGECKFKNEKIDKPIYETLLRRSRLISGEYRLKRLLLFSLSGFSTWFETQHQNDVVLYTLEDLYQ